MKWNMGWMHDTLGYVKEDPVHRRHHHNKLTFAMMYAYSENFVLPLSHDEVVHLKRSLLGKMPGDRWQHAGEPCDCCSRISGCFPGRSCCSWGLSWRSRPKWDFRSPLPWHLLEDPAHAGVQQLVGDLNRLYASRPALHRFEFEPGGFEWIEANDASHSVFSFLRSSGDAAAARRAELHACAPAQLAGGRACCWRVPRGAQLGFASLRWHERREFSVVHAEAVAANGRPASVELSLPPLGALMLEPKEPSIAGRLRAIMPLAARRLRASMPQKPLHQAPAQTDAAAAHASDKCAPPSQTARTPTGCASSANTAAPSLFDAHRWARAAPSTHLRQACASYDVSGGSSKFDSGNCRRATNSILTSAGCSPFSDAATASANARRAASPEGASASNRKPTRGQA